MQSIPAFWPRPLLASRAAFFALGFVTEVASVLVLPAGAEPNVVVIVDMNAGQPGIQRMVRVPPGNPTVEVSVYLYDPLGTRELWGIGYIGALDRGIAFGHVPRPGTVGTVAPFTVASGSPANPGNSTELLSPAMDPAFPGPEVQYLEWGASAKAVLTSEPIRPLFTVTVTLQGAVPDDVFDFYLLDYVNIWSGNKGGAFSTHAPLSLDTGGDAVFDETDGLYGIDVDYPVPVPPASFRVDFVDGADFPGPAIILVVPPTSLEDFWSRPGMTLLPAQPTPFTRTTVIPFEIGAPGHVRLAIHDAAGRRLRVLVEATSFQSGRHFVRWDGRDAIGREVAAGVYFCRLEVGPERAIGRMIRTR